MLKKLFPSRKRVSNPFPPNIEGTGLNKGSVIVFGETHRGVYPHTTATPMQNIKDIAVGSMHGVCITETGSLISWGNNERGQLGCGDRKPDLGYVPVDLPSDAGTPVSISCGPCHTIVATDQGRAFHWGDDAQSLHPVEVPGVREGGIFIRNVAAGPSYSALVDDDGELFVIGENRLGRLGFSLQGVVPLTRVDHLRGERITHAVCGTANMGCATEDGRMLIWGDNHYYQLAGETTASQQNTPVEVTFPTPRRVVKCLMGKGNFVLGALLEDGEYTMWGTGESWQLGMGFENTSQKTPAHLPKFSNRNIVSANIGMRHSAAVDDQGMLFTWGSGESMRLGTGKTDPVYQPQVVGTHGIRISKVECTATATYALTKVIEDEKGEKEETRNS